MSQSSAGRLWFYGLVGLLACATSARGQTAFPQFKLYDAFRGPLLDPARWQSGSYCGSTSLECTREIRQGALGLRVRAYGGVNTQGSQYGSSSLNLALPAPTALAARVVIHATSAAACPANPDGAHGQVLLMGNFFNGGNGLGDDVTAYLQLDRYSTDPEGKVLVGGFLSRAGQFFDNVYLATVDVGEPVVARLVWERANHRFLVQLTRPRYGTTTEQPMPYDMDDTLPAVWPGRTIGAFVYAPNCMTGRPYADMDVRVDQVFADAP